MQINPVSTVQFSGQKNVLINKLANKGRYYIHEEMFSLAKEHKVNGCFGEYYIELPNVPDKLIETLNKLKIKFSILNKE